MVEPSQQDERCWTIQCLYKKVQVLGWEEWSGKQAYTLEMGIYILNSFIKSAYMLNNWHWRLFNEETNDMIPIEMLVTAEHKQ